MEIIKHGNTYKEITCEHCGCTFAYSEKDIKTKRFLAAPFTPYDLDYTWSDVVKCPECNSYTILNDLQSDYLEYYEKEQQRKQQSKKDKNSFIESLRNYKRKEKNS